MTPPKHEVAGHDTNDQLMVPETACQKGGEHSIQTRQCAALCSTSNSRMRSRYRHSSRATTRFGMASERNTQQKIIFRAANPT